MVDAVGVETNSSTAAAEQQLDASEAYFLVLKWLSAGPCQNAAQALLQDVAEHGLLPQRYNIHGDRQAASFQALQQQHSRVPADALVQLLQQVLDRVHAGGQAGAEGLTTLLAEGPLAALPALAAPQRPPVAPWITNPARAVSHPQLQLLQQTGLARRSYSSRLPKQLISARYCHHATFRGHGFPVFALLFDKKGRHVVTGADDANIKFWSLETGLLLVTGRGHTGEISDLSLSADGTMVASGSTDGDVRVWSMLPDNLGQNTAVLRGHTASITLIDFHPKVPSALISASTDGTVRFWDAKDQHFAPLVLVPKSTFGAFSSIGIIGSITQPAAAAAGRSTGAVGTNAVQGAAAAVTTVLQPGQVPQTAAGDNLQDVKGVMSCSWSPDGTLIVASSQDCCVYIWHWDVNKTQSQQQQQPSRSQSIPLDGSVKQEQQQPQQPQEPLGAGVGVNPFEQLRRQIELDLQHKKQQQQQQALQQRRASRCRTSSGNGGLQQQQTAEALLPQQQQQATDPPHQQELSAAAQDQWQALASTDWPAPIELQRLSGHKNEVLQSEFSHSGAMLATASLDGTVRVWRQVRRSGRLRLAWEEACAPLAVTAAPSAATANTKSRPRREQATTLAINQLVWAPDDSQILAAASDNNIRIWCPQTGALLRMLCGHTQQAHVLEVHPFDPHLAMSAGYDGQVILWDTAQGTILKKFSSSDTIPLARGSWAPPVIQLCDGHFSPDGNSFAVADVAGQFSIYALGPPTPLLLSAPYDQFLKKDYDGIMHDEAGFAAYLEPAAVPTFHMARQQPLCDNQFRPYADEFQAAYRAGRVLDFIKMGGGGMCLRGSSMVLPPSLETWPPTVTAAAWKALEDRALLAAQRRGVPSEETVRDTAERQALQEHARLLAALARGMTLQEEEQHVRQLETATAAAASRQQRQHEAVVLAAAPAVPAAAPAVLAAAGAAAGAEYVVFSYDDELERELERDAGELPGSDSDYADQALTDDSDWDDLSDLDSESEDADFGSDASEGRKQQRQQQAHRHSERQRQRRRQREERNSGGMVLRSRRGAAGDDDDEWRGSRGRATRSKRSTAAEGTTPQRPRRDKRKLKRDSDEFVYNDDDAIISESDFEQEQQADDGQAVADGAGPMSDRQRRLEQRRRVRQRTESAAATTAAAADQHAEDGQQQHDTAAAAADSEHPSTISTGGGCRPGRTFDCYAWLSRSQQNPNTYVPQLGDSVVYLFEGHQKYLDAKNDKLTQRPWEVLSRGGDALQQLQWQLQQQQWQQQWQWTADWQQQQANMPYYYEMQPEDQQQQQFQPGFEQLQQQFAQLHQQQQVAMLQHQADHAVPAGSFLGSMNAASTMPIAAEATAGMPEPGTAAAVAHASSTAAATAHAAGVTGAVAAAQAVQNEAAPYGLGVGYTANVMRPSPLQPYQIRPAEPCTVVALEYIIQDEHTVAVLTLQLAAAAAAQTLPAAAAAASAAAEASQHIAATAGVGSSTVAAGSGLQPELGQLQQQQGLSLSSHQQQQQQCLLFQVVLPPPSSGHAEFMVLQSRFEQAVRHAWKAGDRVKNYQLDADHDEGGQWYEGTVVADGRIARPHAEVAADPYGCGGLWGRYQLKWDAEREQSQQQHPAFAATGVGAAAQHASSDGDRDEDADCSWLSPWELYAADLSAEAVLAAEHSTQLTADQVAMLLHALEQLLASRKYKLFKAAPAPHEIHGRGDERQAYNRVVPLPLGLENIQERLTNGYYRSLQAVLHDAALIANNAATYNGADSPVAEKAQECCEYIQAAAAAAAASGGAGQLLDLKQWLECRRLAAQGLGTVADAAAADGWDGVQEIYAEQHEVVHHRRSSRRHRATAVATGNGGQQQQQQRSRRSAAQQARELVSCYAAVDAMDSDDEQQSQDDSGQDAAPAKAAPQQRNMQHRMPRDKQRQRGRARRARRLREDFSTPESSDVESASDVSASPKLRRSGRQRRQLHGRTHMSTDSGADSEGAPQGGRQLRSRQKQQQQPEDNLALAAAAADLLQGGAADVQQGGAAVVQQVDWQQQQWYDPGLGQQGWEDATQQFVLQQMQQQQYYDVGQQVWANPSQTVVDANAAADEAMAAMAAASTQEIPTHPANDAAAAAQAAAEGQPLLHDGHAQSGTVMRQGMRLRMRRSQA